VRVIETAIPGVVVIEPDGFRDARGFFLETYHAGKFAGSGIDAVFVQDNHSRSVGGTLRGLHLQNPHAQGKLLRVIEGEVFDVAVDVRRGSPTFGRWVTVTLSADNMKLCFIPPGFAHGFCVVSPIAQVEYKCTDLYHPKHEIGIAWDDPALAIPWPVKDPVVSPRDAKNPLLAAVMDQLPTYATEL
jgi:dTDP-4-dehydrorhamnose 3,5-epimerase